MDFTDDLTAPDRHARIRPFPRNQLPMPAQEPIWRLDRGEIAQATAAHMIGPGGQAAAIVVCEPQSLVAQLATQKSILFAKIRERLPFPAFQAAGHDRQQQLESRDVEHGRILSHEAKQNRH
jgi:hypothetical protein